MAVPRGKKGDSLVGAVGTGQTFILSLILASNLGLAKSIAPCETMEPDYVYVRQ